MLTLGLYGSVEASSAYPANKAPVGYAVLAIEYEAGQVHAAKVLGGTHTMSDCLDIGRKIASGFLADPSTPNGAAINIACVPIPPAPPGKGDQQTNLSQ